MFGNVCVLFSWREKLVSGEVVGVGCIRNVVGCLVYLLVWVCGRKVVMFFWICLI